MSASAHHPSSSYTQTQPSTPDSASRTSFRHTRKFSIKRHRQLRTWKMANSVPTAEHTEAADILSTLSSGPVVFGPEWQFTPVEEDDIHETDEDETIHAAEILYNMHQGITAAGPRHQSQDDTDTEMEGSETESNTSLNADTLLSPSATMIADITSGESWFRGLLRCRPLLAFAEYSLRGPIATVEAERRLAAVLTAMTERSCVQEACWYLEAHNWNETEAIARYKLDEKHRGKLKSELHKRSNRVAKEVTVFNDLSLLKFHVDDADGSSRTVATLSKARDFDKDSEDHMKVLNQWRNDLTRMFVGPPMLSTTEPFPATLAKYSEFENRFLRNRFGSKIAEFDDKTMTTAFQEIADEFNALFVGRFLPNAYSPCGPRNWTTLKEHILTKIVGRKRDDRTYEKTAVQIQQMKEKERAEFEKLLAGGEDTVEDSMEDDDAGVFETDENAAEKAEVDQMDVDGGSDDLELSDCSSRVNEADDEDSEDELNEPRRFPSQRVIPDSQEDTDKEMIE
ncbi:hypothetical protein H2200_000159 [Cladophialophora chaetospira]|uniref:Uncharacterized protein n=1 Tax=Cladophialophora chaetospira TaxID=386627 RepID=A0AA38XN84_9EURO|nr:hypothetical protein H2200_000159 [Cladophialophora chaetospira]